MAEIINMDKVYSEILALRKDVHYIRTNMIDADSMLTAEEDAELDESLKELEEGKASSLENIEKDGKNA